MRHIKAVEDKEMQTCIDNCRSCHQACVETMYYCLSKGGDHANPNHIGLLLDCAQICETSADFMSRNSELHAEVCGICAEICERCADDCNTMAESDEQMAACEQECRKCMESCQTMAEM